MSRCRSTCATAKFGLSPRSSAIWISDELLSNAFNRFSAFLQQPRRHGSFVPGPMECRRRLGKRRMAHLSENGTPASYDFGALWGSPRDQKDGQWQWQAPAKQQEVAPENNTLLPSWLSQWKPSPEEAPSTSSWKAELVSNSMDVTSAAVHDLETFRVRIQGAQQEDISAICEDFNKLIKQDLNLGLIADQTLYSALQSVTAVIRESADWGELHCLSFYQAVWGGIESCKVFRPIDFGAATMDLLLCLVSQLPMGIEAQSLARSVLQSVSLVQMQSMTDGIHRVVAAWARTWQVDDGLGNCETQLAAAERFVQDAHTKLKGVQTMVTTLSQSYTSKNVKRYSQQIQQAVVDVDLAITRGIQSVREADQAMWISKASVAFLVAALENVPRVILRQALELCSIQVAKECRKLQGKSWKIRYCWYSLIARLRYVRTEDLIQHWRAIEPRDASLREEQVSELLLSHWTSQGYFKYPLLVRNTFEVSGTPDSGFASLLSAIYKHEGNSCWTRAQELLALLHGTGRYKVVFKTLARLVDLGIKLPKDLFIKATETMSNYDVCLALDLWKLHVPMQLDRKLLQIQKFPNFVTAMINDARIRPKTIWTTVGIPTYEDLPPRHRVSTKTLKPSTVTLINNMALAFAQSEARPARVALRNVAQCMHHLRIHRVEVTPEISRAVTHAVITRAVVGGWQVGQQRLRWALGLIAYVEGPETAAAVEETWQYWVEQVNEKRRRNARECNVLRTGPID